MTRRSMAGNRNGGFTLIEVVIAMAIIAILAAIAIPAYTAYVVRGYRSDARSTLLQGAQWMERWRTERGSYSAGPPTLPTGLAQSPPHGTARYTIALSALTAGAYTLTATPVGSMSTDPCGNYSVSNLGIRAHSGSESELTCWGR